MADTVLAAQLYTLREFLKTPEDNRRREIIDGELIVSPSPLANHQRVLRKLVNMVENFLLANPIGEMFFAPLDTILAQEQVLQPDLLYVSNERASIISRCRASIRALTATACSARRDDRDARITAIRSGLKRRSSRCSVTRVSSFSIGIERPLQAVLPLVVQLEHV